TKDIGHAQQNKNCDDYRRPDAGCNHAADVHARSSPRERRSRRGAENPTARPGSPHHSCVHRHALSRNTTRWTRGRTATALSWLSWNCERCSFAASFGPTNSITGKQMPRGGLATAMLIMAMPCSAPAQNAASNDVLHVTRYADDANEGSL